MERIWSANAVPFQQAVLAITYSRCGHWWLCWRLFDYCLSFYFCAWHEVLAKSFLVEIAKTKLSKPTQCPSWYIIVAFINTYLQFVPTAHSHSSLFCGCKIPFPHSIVTTHMNWPIAFILHLFVHRYRPVRLAIVLIFYQQYFKNTSLSSTAWNALIFNLI